jgi:hypothetical protein
LKLPDHPVTTGQARRGFPGTQWRGECEEKKFIFIVPLHPAHSTGLVGHLPVRI